MKKLMLLIDASRTSQNRFKISRLRIKLSTIMESKGIKGTNNLIKELNSKILQVEIAI